MEKDKGSIIVVIATNAPLDNRQLKRVAGRSIIGIGKTGSYGGNGSGDVFVAFSTENKVMQYNDNVEEQIKRIPDDYIDYFFDATIDATEEAVLNSLLYAKGAKSYNGNYFKSLMEYKELFKDLLENDQ